MSAPERLYFNLRGVAIVKWDAPSKGAHIEWQGWQNQLDVAYFATLDEARVWLVRT